MNKGITREIIPFDFEEASVRIVTIDGQPWFALTDVCRALELKNPAKVALRLDSDEKGITTVSTRGGPQKLLVVSEPGLYGLLLTSRKPSARRFENWVCDEVLPSIRKTGFYIHPNKAKELLLDPTNLSQAIRDWEKAARELRDHQEKLTNHTISDQGFMLLPEPDPRPSYTLSSSSTLHPIEGTRKE